MSSKTRTTFYIDKTLHSHFKKICDREGESMSQKVEEFERRYEGQYSKILSRISDILIGARPESLQAEIREIMLL